MDDTNSLIEQRKAKLAALRVALLAVVCVFLAGCFDTKQDITLNPDGSGKMVIESVFTQTPALFKGTSQASPQEGVTNFIRKLIEEAGGVDAWRDISFHQRDDGKTFFRGTAYFADLSKFKLGTMIFHGYSVTRDETGNLTISLAASAPAGSPIQRTNEPITAESLQRDRATLRSAMPLLQSTLGTMKQDTTIHAPGIVKRASNFETTQFNTLHILFDGAKLMQAIEHFSFDTNFDHARISGERSSLEDLMNERLYGQRAPIVAVIKPGTAPLFDYAKEVAEARRIFPGFARQLRQESIPIEVPKPAVDGQPATLKVTGIEWFGEDSPTRGYRFSGDGRRGYTVHLRAALSGIVLRAEKVRFTRATTLDGLDLLPPNRNADLTANPVTSKDGSSVSFQVNLKLAPAESRGLSELSGTLECAGMASQRTVELISGKLRAGARGAEFDTQIESFDPRMSGMDRLSLRTRLKPEQLRSLRVVGDAGQFSHLEQRGHTVVGDTHIITYVSRNEIPSTGKIVAEVLAGEQTLRIPFALTNVTLLGQPLTK